MSLIRVALAEDHLELRLALRLLIGLFADMELIWEVSDGRDAVDYVQRFPPDVLVMDIRMPGLNGSAATRQIIDLGKGTPVILISADRGSHSVRKSMEAGAKGFVPKDDLVSLLPMAIRAAFRGETSFQE
jgi:DNA-binding NarL/FixJ family response regulator